MVHIHQLHDVVQFVRIQPLAIRCHDRSELVRVQVPVAVAVKSSERLNQVIRLRLVVPNVPSEQNELVEVDVVSRRRVQLCFGQRLIELLERWVLANGSYGDQGVVDSNGASVFGKQIEFASKIFLNK